MPTQYWLVKQEPSGYPFSALVKDKKTSWTGVRNFQARKNLRSMKKGDQVLYYHSGEDRQVVGLASVVREAYPDPTAKEGDWSTVDLAAVKTLPQPVDLAVIKGDKALQDVALVRQSRLSVMPLTKAHFDRILKLAKA